MLYDLSQTGYVWSMLMIDRVTKAETVAALYERPSHEQPLYASQEGFAVWFTFTMTHIRRRSLAIVCMACLFLNACSFTRPAGDTVFMDGPRGAVSLRSVEDSWFKTAHPVSVSPPLLTHVLRGIEIQASPDDPTTAMRVFSEEETAFLSPLINTALAKATKNQLVAFRVMHGTDPRGDMTGGLLFTRGRLLHLWLTHYRVPSVGIVPGATLDRHARHPKGLDPRRLRFLPKTVQQPSLHQQPDIIDPPPLATLLIDYQMLAAQLNLPSESTHARSSHAAQSEPAIPVSQEAPSAAAEATQALKERMKVQAIELDTLKEEMRALRNRLSEMEEPASNQMKPRTAPR